MEVTENEWLWCHPPMEGWQLLDEHPSFPALWWDSPEARSAQFLRGSPVGQPQTLRTRSSQTPLTGFPPVPVPPGLPHSSAAWTPIPVSGFASVRKHLSFISLFLLTGALRLGLHIRLVTRIGHESRDASWSSLLCLFTAYTHLSFCGLRG